MSPVNHARKLFYKSAGSLSLALYLPWTSDIVALSLVLSQASPPFCSSVESLEVVHLLRWLWLVMDSITAAEFWSGGTGTFGEGTTSAGVTLDLWLVPMGGATLFLLLPGIWCLYQPDYCENELNR